jgi:hypothetical protein
MLLTSVDFIDRLPDFYCDVGRMIREYKTIEDRLEDVSNHGNATLVQRKFHLIKNNIRSDVFETLPYTNQLVNQISKLYEFNSVNYRMIMPNTCYNWHYDTGGHCLHVPLITNHGCRFVYDSKAFSMPSDGSIYIVNNSIHHSFMNAGPEPRLHFTFENL